MTRFYGKASCKVDEKGRIVLPAMFRDALLQSGADAGGQLVIRKNIQQPCLDIFTERAWSEQSDRILAALEPELSAADADFWTRYNDGVHALAPDAKLGRLNIPSELLEKAGIGREAIVTGLGYKMQVWNAQTHRERLLPDDVFQKEAARIAGKEATEKTQAGRAKP